MAKQAYAFPNPTNVVTTAETVVAGPIPITINEGSDPRNLGILIQGIVTVSLGASTTSITIKCRYNTVGGAQVGNNVFISGLNATGAPFQTFPFMIIDPTTAPLNSNYVITVTQGAATGNGSVSNCVVSTEPITSVL